jgi:DNA-binding transcriptional LysR family regulator
MLECLRIFVDIVDLKSFSRAATKNHLTQSAVSQRIQQLEDELGQVLLLRGRGHLRLTEAGEIYYSACREVLSRYDRAVDAIHGLADVVSGQLRVGTITSVGLHELPPYIKIFLKEFPGVELQLEYRTSQAVYEGVLDFSLDLGIVAYPLKHPQLVVTPIRHDELVLITPPEHPLSQFQAVSVQKIDRQPFIAFTHEIPTRRAVDRMLRTAGTTSRIVHQFDNVETIKRAVEIGAGVSIVPRATVKHELENGTLCGVRLRGRGWTRPLAALAKRGYPMTPATEEFLGVLRRDLNGGE